MEKNYKFLSKNVIKIRKDPFVKGPKIAVKVRPGGIVVEDGKKPFFRIVKR